MDRIRRYCTDTDADTVRWVEQENRVYRGATETQRLLCSAPIEVGGWLRTMIWDKVPAVIMSATLGLKTGYLARTMGLGDGEAETFDAGSPFDYAEQAVLFTPDSSQPSPKEGPKWTAWSQQVTRRLVLKAGGDALLLFTSRRSMESAYEGLAGEFEEAGIRVLKQGDLPNGELLSEFKRGGAVLFGLKTWMEGVDVPGKALRLVVLDKLPFAVPTDILVAARADAYEAVHGRKSSFYGITCPAMELTLEQACGRLIRTVEDTGVMAVLDSRLATGYGTRILAGLPPARRTHDLRDAEAFLAATA
jgi:ATP-dependent DNA helicase DinG